MSRLGPMALVLLAACTPSGPAPGDEAADAPVLTTRLVEEPTGGTALEVLLLVPTEAEVALDVPEDPVGLSLGEPTRRDEPVGATRAITWRFPIDPEPGSTILEGVCATVDGGQPVCADPLYLDFGSPPDRTELVDIVEAEALWPVPPWQVLGGALLLGLGVAGAVSWWRRREVPVVVEPAPTEAPDRAALRRWDAIRHDPELSDFDKAFGLSEVFRAYAEAVLAFPAQAFTTTETLSHLSRLAHLPKGNIPRARRILRATDRVKYAGKRPNERFFEDLDSDLRAFVDSTRPRTWDDDAGGAP